MVTKQVRILVIAIFLSLTSSCLLEDFWGEKPAPSRIAQDLPTDQPCPEPSQLFDGSYAQAHHTLNCIEIETLKAFDSIRSTQPDSINSKELSVLVRKRVIRFSDDPKRDELRIRAILQMLDLGDRVSKQSLAEWFNWFQDHLDQMRAANHFIYKRLDHEKIYFSEIGNIAKILARFLERVNWVQSPFELSKNLEHAFDVRDSEVVRTLQPLAEFAVDFFGALCPQLSTNVFFYPKEIAACIPKSIKAFAPGGPWFEFALNPVVYPPEKAPLIESLSQLIGSLKEWFSQSGLEPLHTSLWFNLTEAMGVKPPNDFVESLSVVRHIGKKSNQNEVHPVDIPIIFEIYRDYHSDVLDGLPFYLEATNSGNCVGGLTSVETWKQCVPFNLTTLFAANRAGELMSLMTQPYFGWRASPPNGAKFTKVQLFSAFAKRAMEAFDTNYDGVISSKGGSNEDPNEVAKLLTVTLASAETLSAFIDNVDRKIKGYPVTRFVPTQSFANLDMQGLAKVIALAGSESFVNRDRKQKGIFKKLISNVTNFFPQSLGHLDHSALTSVLSMIGSLGSYQRAYYKTIYGEAPPEILQNIRIPRNQVIENLDEILNEHFRRTYESCSKKGFGVSCLKVFDHILAGEDPKDASVSLGDLDVITLVAAMIEGIFHYCDDDEDGELSMAPLNGNDELDCGYVSLKDITLRLADAKIINLSQGGQNSLQFVLEFFNTTFLTRPFGKVAIARGTLKGAVFNPLLIPKFAKATIGSTYSLMGEVFKEKPSKGD